MDESLSQYFNNSPDLQVNATVARALPEDHAVRNLWNTPLPTWMTPLVLSDQSGSTQSSLPRPFLDASSYTIAAPNDHTRLNHAYIKLQEAPHTYNGYTPALTPGNRLDFAHGYSASIIHPQHVVRNYNAENMPDCSTMPNQFHRYESSPMLSQTGQVWHSGYVPTPTSLPDIQPGGEGSNLGEHYGGHRNTRMNLHQTDKSKKSKTTESSASSGGLPSNPPVRGPLPFVFCCLPNCGKIYQGFDAFRNHLRAEKDAPDPGHELTTSSRKTPREHCSWEGCGKEVSPAYLLKHIEQHTLIDFQCAACPYTSCIKLFTLQHFKEKHSELRLTHPLNHHRAYEIPARRRRTMGLHNLTHT